MPTLNSIIDKIKNNKETVLVLLIIIFIWRIVKNNLILIGAILYLAYKIKSNITEGFHHGVFSPINYNYGFSSLGDGDNNNTVFSSHPNKLICSYPQNEMMKHARLNRAGGVMYISYKKPTDTNRCKKIDCPCLTVDGITPHRLDRYDPYPLREDKLTCWSC